MKNFLKGLSILVVCILLANCEKEEFIETSSENQKNVSINLIDQQEIFQNAAIKSRIKEINEISLSKSYATGGSFEIISDQANYLVSDDFHSYTFAIKRAGPNEYIENYVLSLNEDGTYQNILYQYLVDKNIDKGFITKRNVLRVNVKFLDDNYSPSNLIQKSGDCDLHFWKGPNDSDLYNDEEECEAQNGGAPCTILYSVLYDCEDDGDNNNNSSSSAGTGLATIYIYNPDSFSSEPLFDNTGTNSSSNNGDTAVLLTPLEAVLSIFGSELTFFQQITLSNLDNDAQLYIFNYLTENGNSQEAKDLISQALSDLMSFTLSSYPGKDDGLPFEWWLDLDFIENSGNFDMPAIIDGIAVVEKPNAKEVALFAGFPFQALFHIANTETATQEAHNIAVSNIFSEGSVNKSLNNGKSDAFRHAFWNALDVKDFGERITKMFTDAHEDGKIGITATMDLFNNGVGRNVALSNGWGLFSSSAVISQAIQSEITNGNLQYITPTNINGGVINGVSQRRWTNQ